MAIFRRKGVGRYKQCCGSALVSADPDPDFYLNMDPDPVPNPGSQTNADSCGFGSCSDLKVTKS
jgi:hypothetical protein